MPNEAMGFIGWHSRQSRSSQLWGYEEMEYRSLRSLASVPWQVSEGQLMAAFQGYFDDSWDSDRNQRTVMSFGGYVGPVEAWDEFERRWIAALGENCAPYLHMRKFAHSHPPFDGWKGDEPRRAKFLGDLVAAVKGSGLFGAGACVDLAVLDAFNQKHGLSIQPAPLCIYLISLRISNQFPRQSVQAKFDRMSKAYTIFAQAEEYAQSDGSPQNIMRWINLSQIMESSETVPALQLADFAAYEILHFNRKRRTDPELIRRKSFEALLNAEPINGMFVDEQSIEAVHRLREGGWPFNDKGREAMGFLETRERLEEVGVLTFN